MSRPTIAILFLMTLGIGATRAQVVPGQIGLFASGGGRTAGTTCSGFSCRSALLVAKPNIRFEFTVRATKDAPFFVIFGAQANQCVSIPGFVNRLVVLPALVSSGVVNTPDPGGNCTGFKASFQLTVPGSVRKGTRLAVQALAIVKDSKSVPRPSFSSAIEMVVL